jgi:pimeloyl-ACP methyl ester carboxylesterase
VDKAALVGHSMGVPVICRVYKQAPEKVAALIAIDGTLRRPQISAEQAGQFVATFRAPEYRENTRRIMGSMFPVPGTEALRDGVVSELLATPQYVMVSAMEGMFGTDQPDWDVKKATVPVVAINAPNPMWTDEYKDYIRSLSPQTEYRLIEGAGHWLMLEKPAEFNAAITGMLRKFGLIAE